MSETSTEPIDFEQLREFFADEDQHGQLFDIVTPDIDLAGWGVFLRQVVPQYTYRFALLTGEASISQQIPEDTDAVVRGANSESGPWPDLGIDLLGLVVRVHFFGPNVLELDVRRSEVTAERYAALCTLMQRMGDSMGIDVFGTPETAPSEAEFVYEVAHRRFRRPRHGDGTDGKVRDVVLNGLRQALSALRGPDSSNDVVRDILVRIEAVRAGHRELVLQDELTIEARRMFDEAWSLAATIATPPAGVSSSKRDRDSRLTELTRIARVLR